MRRFILLLALSILVTATAFTQTQAGRHKIELDDPIGDVQENDGKPGKDVVKVSINSDGENLHIIACIKYKDGGLACVGAVGGEIEGFCSSYKIYEYEQAKKMPKNTNNALEATEKDIAGKQVEITLPYSEIGIKSGGRMRISIRESDSSFDDKSYFPQVFFIIK